MKTEQYEIGMVGLGVMGRNLLLNMADRGHSVAGYDKDVTKVAALRLEAETRNIRGAADIQEFIALLRQPRAVMMLVPAGPPVDSVINDLLARLQPGDLIIDAGNSYFKDTDVRARNLRAQGRQFRGIPDLPHRPFFGQGNGAEHSGLPFRQSPLRADLEPALCGMCHHHRSRSGRSRTSRRLLRSRRRPA